MKKVILYITSSLLRFLSMRILFLIVPLIFIGNLELIVVETLLMLLFFIISPGIEICIYLLIDDVKKHKWFWMSFRILELLYYFLYVILIFKYI